MAASVSAEEACEKVLKDDELENKDLDIESEEIEDDAFENKNFLAEMANILSMQVWKCWFRFTTYSTLCSWDNTGCLSGE